MDYNLAARLVRLFFLGTIGTANRLNGGRAVVEGEHVSFATVPARGGPIPGI